MTERLVIIGSGMATARLLEALVENGYRGAVTVLGEEPQPSYNRILLSPLLCGDAAPDDLPLLDLSWYRDHNIRLMTGARAEMVDLVLRRVHTSAGSRVPFDRLVLATGSRPLVPDIPGGTKPGVMGFRTFADLQRLQTELTAGDSVVVVGGGLLGLEAAHGLVKRGISVTVVHRQPWLMNRQLDEDGGAMLRDLLAQRGISFRFGASPVAIDGEGQSLSVVLDKGVEVSARLVLFAAGIVPNTELAADSGIACGRGIRVDAGLATGVPGVYALGECCQLDEITFGLVAPVVAQAGVLAARLCGDTTATYQYREAPVQLKVSGVELFSAGAVPAGNSGLDHQVLRDSARGVYRRLVFSGNRLTAAVLLGDRRDGSWYGELIDSGTDVSGLRDSLLFGREYCQRVPC